MHGAIGDVAASPLQGFGAPSYAQFDSPAAGADFTYSAAGIYLERFLTLHVKLVTDGNAANREVVVSFEGPGSRRFALAGINTTVPASQTVYYEFSVFQPEAVATVDSSALVPLPAVVLGPGIVLKVHVVNIQATDQLSQICGWREQFPRVNPPAHN